MWYFYWISITFCSFPSPYFVIFIHLPFIRITIKSQFGSQCFGIQSPAFHVTGMNWESWRALKVTGRKSISWGLQIIKYRVHVFTYLLSSITCLNCGISLLPMVKAAWRWCPGLASWRLKVNISYLGLKMENLNSYL